MKSFAMVLLATAAFAFPAQAERRDQTQMPRDQYQHQGRTNDDSAWRGEHSGQTRSSIHAADLSAGQIREIQRSLRDAGHNVGGVDGKWGPNTRQALKDFQDDKGMTATGRLSRRVIGALGLDPQRFASDYDREDRGLNSGSERGHHYGYSGRDRDYGYGGRERDYGYRSRDRSRNDYSPRGGERY